MEVITPQDVTSAQTTSATYNHADLRTGAGGAA
jgi:hypothetical protein